jgi:hypothetical protein
VGARAIEQPRRIAFIERQLGHLSFRFNGRQGWRMWDVRWMLEPVQQDGTGNLIARISGSAPLGLLAQDCPKASNRSDHR